jgi:amino-acid N-acetyltransferase
MEIDRFFVLEHDRVIIGCAALYQFEDGMAELAGLAVHPDHRRAGAGERLLHAIEARAKQRKVKQLFVLTTRTAHWFIERGFSVAAVSALPRRRQDLYNYQRRSQVFIKRL